VLTILYLVLLVIFVQPFSTEEPMARTKVRARERRRKRKIVRSRERSLGRRTKALTLSVPEAGERYFAMGKNASYEAALRGDIPTIRIGKLLRVPIRAMEKLLDQAGAVG
jgi:hypothetical protein